MKAEVSEEARANARAMAEEALAQRLKEIKMTAAESKMYTSVLEVCSVLPMMQSAHRALSCVLCSKLCVAFCGGHSAGLPASVCSDEALTSPALVLLCLCKMFYLLYGDTMFDRAAV